MLSCSPLLYLTVNLERKNSEFAAIVSPREPPTGDAVIKRVIVADLGHYPL